MASEVAVLIGLSMPERRRYAGLFEQEATLHARQRWCPEGCYTGVREGRPDVLHPGSVPSPTS